jgi:hypothetical protein
MSKDYKSLHYKVSLHEDYMLPFFLRPLHIHKLSHSRPFHPIVKDDYNQFFTVCFSISPIARDQSDIEVGDIFSNILI